MFILYQQRVLDCGRAGDGQACRAQSGSSNSDIMLSLIIIMSSIIIIIISSNSSSSSMQSGGEGKGSDSEPCS